MSALVALSAPAAAARKRGPSCGRVVGTTRVLRPQARPQGTAGETAGEMKPARRRAQDSKTPSSPSLDGTRRSWAAERGFALDGFRALENHSRLPFHARLSQVERAAWRWWGKTGVIWFGSERNALLGARHSVGLQESQPEGTRLHRAERRILVGFLWAACGRSE